MGTEKGLTTILVRQIQEGGGVSPAGLRMAGGTPNHKALARCVGYGWGLATPEDREEGHMAFGRASEFGTSSHFAWWQNALAGLWKLAEREGDEEVLEGVRGWWVALDGHLKNAKATRIRQLSLGKAVVPGFRPKAR